MSKSGSLFFLFMDQSCSFAENGKFYDVEIQSFMHNNEIYLDSQTEEVLAQKVVACLQQVIYVMLM